MKTEKELFDQSVTLGLVFKECFIPDVDIYNSEKIFKHNIDTLKVQREEYSLFFEEQLYPLKYN